VDQDTVSKVMKEMGRKGGRRRMEALTDPEKRELGRKAGLASGKARRAKKAKAKKG
jgi:general stress protein YciG